LPTASPGGNAGAWFVASSGTGAEFDPPVLGATVPPATAVVTPDGLTYSGLTAAADLDGDGKLESVVVAPNLCPNPLGGELPCPNAASLLIGTFQGASAKDPFVYQSTMLSGVAVSQEGQLGVADLNGDGFPDIVLLGGSIADAALGGSPFCGTSPATRSLYVFFNDGTGHFDTASPTPVAGGKGWCASPTAFMTLTLSPSGPPVLAYVTHNTAHYLEVTPGAGEAAPTVTIAALPDVPIPEGSRADCCGSDSSEYSGIAAADVDGDGVEDFVIVDHGNLVAYKGVPRVPGAP
jgi:hypothetical protein